MIDLPKRTIQHEIDSRGVAILQYILGDEFIFRQISERDYGIDALIELTLDNRVLGKFISVQIKSKQNISWNRNGKFKMRIENSSINYWITGNNPPILLLVDVSRKNAYFVNIREQVRVNYDNYVKNNFSFEFNINNDILSKPGYTRLIATFLTELEYHNYIASVNELAVNWKVYFEHIISNQNRDFFLTVEEDQIQMTQYIAKIINNIENYLLINYEKVNFEDIRQKSIEVYKHYYKSDYYEIIELENDAINRHFEKRLKNVIEILKGLVTIKEEEFWRTNYLITYDKFINMDLESYLYFD